MNPDAIGRELVDTSDPAEPPHRTAAGLLSICVNERDKWQRQVFITTLKKSSCKSINCKKIKSNMVQKIIARFNVVI